MYFDFDDLRPDVPRVPRAISVREGVLLSLVLHLALVIVILVAPFGSAEAPVAWVPPPPPEDAVRFVHMEPLVERPAPPAREPEISDRDRRASSPERAVVPENSRPASRGNTPEKVAGGPAEPPRGADAAPPPPVPAADAPAVRLDASRAPVPVPPAERPRDIGESLRNLQRYLRADNYGNQGGGVTDREPDIQFDSKGVEFGPWLRRFVAQVKSNWFVPTSAQFMQGHVVLQFNVWRDGRITDLRVVKPSGVESFNTSSFNALKLSNPTMPLPVEYPADHVFFTVTFRYNERPPDAAQ